MLEPEGLSVSGPRSWRENDRARIRLLVCFDSKVCALSLSSWSRFLSDSGAGGGGGGSCSCGSSRTGGQNLGATDGLPEVSKPLAFVWKMLCVAFFFRVCKVSGTAQRVKKHSFPRPAVPLGVGWGEPVL